MTDRSKPPDVRATLDALLARRILVLDGAMGTMIQRRRLTEADFRGERFRAHPRDLRGDNDLLVLTRPDVIGDIHHEYLEAGSDIIETNTFNGTAVAQADYGLEPIVYELNRAAGRLAREAADAWTARTPDRPRFVAGSMGPTNRTLSISPEVNNPAFRAITFDELRDAYKDQVRGLVDGGCDLLLLETIFDTLNAKAGIVAIEEVFEEKGVRLPLMISVTVTDRERTYALGADRRCLLDLDCPRASVQRRPQLRARRARHAAVSGGAGAPRRLLHQLLSERRPPERVRRVRRAPAGHGRLPARVRRQRLRRHRRRLLRHDARPYPRHRRGRRGAAAPRNSQFRIRQL